MEDERVLISPSWQERLQNQDYKNWLKVGYGLDMVCKAIRPYIERETKAFHGILTNRLHGVPLCVCTYTRRPYHDTIHCLWAKEVLNYHTKGKPTWNQSNASLWHDPNAGYWEVAKLYMPFGCGGNSCAETDATGLLNLLLFCNYYKTNPAFVEKLKDTRNTWGHAPKHELNAAEMTDAFISMKNFLQDPELVSNPDAIDALNEVTKLESDNLIDFEDIEAKVIRHLKDFIISIKDEIIEKVDQNAGLAKEIKDILLYCKKCDADRDNVLSDIKDMIDAIEQREKEKRKSNRWVWNTFENIGLSILSLALLTFMDVGRIIPCRSRVLFFFLVLNVTILEEDLVDFGCERNTYDDPFKIKQFDFTEYLNRAQEGFVGRQWLFNNITDSLEVKRKESKGLIIVGPPGFGKSALISNLICSKLSSLSTHTQILGYHFCIHSDKNTLSGAKFVRNLANMIASRLPEYKNLLSKEKFIQRILKVECLGDPSGCFEQGILAPLLKLQLRFQTPRYIVVDALDECLDEKERSTGRSIVDVLQHKIKWFPSWLKVISTSRNQSNIRRKIKNLDVIELHPDDPENLRDIERYLATKLEGSVLSRVRRYGFSGIDMSLSDLVQKSQGNFLYIKLILKHLQTRDLTSDKIYLPDSINDVYQKFFERKYDSHEKFRAPRKIFEILVATKSPVTVMELFDILSNENKDFDFDYDLLPILEDLSMYLLYTEERQSRVSVFHNSLTEWLTSGSNRGGIFYVNEKKGSRALADHFLKVVHGNFTKVDPKFIFDLTTYMVVGGQLKRHTDSFLRIDPKFIKVKDKRTGFTALHLAAEAEDEKLLGILLKIFENPNIEDSKGRTPAFVAVMFGRSYNLRLLHKKGASLSAVTKRNTRPFAKTGINEDILECKRQLCGYSLLHVAAHKGLIEIASYLIKHGSDVSLLSGTGNTALQLAAEFGHIEIMKLLLSHGADVDNTCLYFAAFYGQVEIVKFLLEKGVKDSCIHCGCIIEVSNFVRHCNTALHAAAIGDHPDVIEILFRSKHNAVNCVNYFGKEPIHEAVYHNNYRAVVEFLKHGVDTSKTCKFSVSEVLFDDKFCSCGYSPLHLAAERGFASIAKLLLDHKAAYNATDCEGLEPIHVASCRGHADVISILVEHGADINSRDPNDMTPIHYACKCEATGIFGKLFELGANGLALTADGKTPLNFLVEGYFTDKTFYFVDPYGINPIDPVNFESSEDNIVKSHMREHSWLTSSIKFLQSFTKADITLSELGAALGPLQSFLSYQSVLPGSIINEISILLLGSDRHQNTRLVVLATPAPLPVDIGLAAFLRNQHTSLNQLSTSTVLPSFVKKGVSTALMTVSGKINFKCSMLAQFIHHNMVYAVDVFLQLGMDVNCEESGMSPLLAYLRQGGRNMAKVLAKHNVTIDIQCGEYFTDSAFHLAAYHKLHYLQYLSMFEDPIKWEEYLKEENALFDYLFDVYEEVSSGGQLKLTRVRDGPVTVAIESSFRGSKIIDECLDNDGYTALHRAAQGGNVVAVKHFLIRDANPSLKTPDQEFDSLVLSIWYAVKYRPYFNLFRPSLLTSLEIEFASLTASAILKYLTKNKPFDIGCDENRITPTLLHLAATRGMWRFIDELFVARSNRRVTGLTANCPTKDNITPMYLAKLHGGDDCVNWDNPWCKVVGVLSQYGGSMIYPDRITEYFLILNFLFHELPDRYNINELNQEEIQLLSGDNKECKELQDHGYIFTGRLLESILLDDHHNLLYNYPLESQDGLFHSLRSQYLEIIKRLAMEESLFRSTKLDYDLFLSTKLISLKYSLHNYRRNDDSILKCVPHTMDPIPKHPAISNLNAQQILEEKFEKANREKRRIDQMEEENILDVFLLFPDMCSSKSTVDFQIIDKLSQKNRLIFNKHHETFAKRIKNAKQEIRQKKVKIGIFDSVDSLFRDYESRMHCQTKDIVYKYARFRFVLHTIKFWSTQVKKLGMYPLIPRFASERILEIFQSEEHKAMLPFIIKLAKIDPSERYAYLKMFRFSSPPLEEQFLKEPATFKD